MCIFNIIIYLSEGDFIVNLLLQRVARWQSRQNFIGDYLYGHFGEKYFCKCTTKSDWIIVFFHPTSTNKQKNKHMFNKASAEQ